MNELEKDMDAIYRRYATPLKRFIFGMCHDEDLADDVIADTFYKAIKNIDSFKEGNIFTWLCSIAKNTLLNSLKRKESQNISLEDESFAEPASPDRVEDEVINKESRIELYKLMQTLDPVERDVMYLRIFGELSYGEIGEVLGRTENWTRVTFFRSKEKLKRRTTK